jgi:hypothetical protein
METPQKIMTGKEKVCKICGYVARHQGALNIHMYHCKIKHGQHAAVQKSMEQETCAQTGNHSWRLLNRYKREEQIALSQGYNEVCSKCQEVQ